MGLRKFFCNLFGCAKDCPECPDCPDTNRPMELVALSNLDMNAPVGASVSNGIRAQVVYTDDGSPAADAAVELLVLKGPAGFPGGSQKLQLKSDAQGIVQSDVLLKSAGYSLLSAGFPGTETGALYFAARSNNMTAQIFLYAKPCQPASQGMIEVEISAVDYDGQAVTGAKLNLDAHNNALFDEGFIDGTVQETGAGRYRGVIKNRVAGSMMVTCQDLHSWNKGSTVVHVLPGPPTQIAVIGNIDPRAEKPYSHVDLQVQVRDAEDNPLPPTGLQAVDENGKVLPVRLENDNAFVRVEAVGYQYLNITLLEKQAELKETVTVMFAATWLTNPGLVLTGSDYKTSLHVTPRPDTSTDHGTVTIQFNPELVKFSHFEPSGLFKAEFSSEVKEDKLILQFQSKVQYPANDFPEGMYLGEVCWTCQGDGETCFALSGRMSPTTDPWDLCVRQKTERNDCICINVISIAGNAASLTAGNQVADNVDDIFSSATNVGNCCPVLTVQRHNTTITQAQLNALVGRDGTVTTRAEQRALHADGTGVRANCINIKSVPVSIRRADGATVLGNTDRGRGSILLDPASASAGNNLGEHEVGHTLDLDHRDEPGALMKPFIPMGSGLNSDECEKVFKNIGKYKC